MLRQALGSFCSVPWHYQSISEFKFYPSLKSTFNMIIFSKVELNEAHKLSAEFCNQRCSNRDNVNHKLLLVWIPCRIFFIVIDYLTLIAFYFALEHKILKPVVIFAEHLKDKKRLPQTFLSVPWMLNILIEHDSNKRLWLRSGSPKIYPGK